MASETKQHFFILVFFSCLFFVSSLILTLPRPLYNSPDETANAFFAQTFAKHGRLFISEPLNEVLGDVLYPRSIVAFHGRLLPGSFLGLPVLYGLFIRIFGGMSLSVMTPVIAVFAVFAWYAILRRLFGSRTALLASLLLFSHPAWWYYTARGLMHNVLFTSCLIFAAFFFLVHPFHFFRERFRYIPSWIDALLGGMCVGFSLFVRTSEAVWVGILFFVCLFWIGKRFGWFRIVVAIFGVILVLIPLLLFNRSLYSNLFATGYTVGIADEQASIVSIPVSPQTQDRSLVEIAPFGIHPRIAWMNVRLYGIELFWWISVLVLLGIPLIFTKNGEQNVSWHARGAYLFLFLFVAGWLALMYGSWTIHDNPDPSVVTIGNSYIRYWLPIFVMTTPFVALAVQWICRRARTQFARRFAYGCMMLLLFGLGMRAAFFAPQDGLVAMRERLVTYTAIRDRVFILTEPDAVFIVDRADKLFFPERRIRYPLRDEKTYALLPDIASRAPLYYYGITLPEVDVNYLNTEKLPPLGLRIEHRETFGQESLYHFVLFHP